MGILVKCDPSGRMHSPGTYAVSVFQSVPVPIWHISLNAYWVPRVTLVEDYTQLGRDEGKPEREKKGRR